MQRLFSVSSVLLFIALVAKEASAFSAPRVGLALAGSTSTTRAVFSTPLSVRNRIILSAENKDDGATATATKPQEVSSSNSGVVDAPRPDPSVLLSAQDDTTQQLGFAAICGGIFLGTIVFIQLLNGLESILPAGCKGPFVVFP